jgi:hypothetical protein
MKTISHQLISRTAGVVIAAFLFGTTIVIGGPASAAVPLGAPGPIPSIHYNGNGPQSVSLSWDAPLTAGSSDVTDYQVGFREPGGVWSVFDDGVSVARTATVTGLTTGRDFEFRVAAINLAGVGPSTVMGGLTSFQRESTFLCGTDPASQMWCSDYRMYRKSVQVYDYDGLVPVREVTDLVGTSGACNLSKSLGVICSTDRNLYGELGRGFIGGRGGTFVVPGLPENVISVTSYGDTNCALTSSNDLLCWGRWSYDNRAVPIMVPTVVLRNVTQFVGFCALLTDHSVSCLKMYSGEYRWMNHADIPPIRTMGSGYDGSSCGVAMDGSVICFRPFETSGYDTVAGIADAYSVIVATSYTCVLRTSGTVTCWGDNRNGNLGDGTRTDGTATVRLPEPVIAMTRPQTDYYFGSTCATGISSTMYCWGDYKGPVVNGTPGPYYMPVEVSTVGVFRARGMEAPGKVTSVTQTAAHATSVTIGWSPVTAVAPVIGYVVSWRSAQSDTWSSESVSASERAWTSPTIPTNSSVEVKVAAVNAAGIGAYSDITTVSTTLPPMRMLAPTVVASTVSSVTVAWSPAADRNEPITAYRVEWSNDHVTWQSMEVPANILRKTFTDLGVATAIDVRISAINAAGTSSASPVLTAYVSGLASHTIKVVDSWGQAAYGGQITWRKADGSFESALDYGLTVDGRATFPAIPAGPVDVTLRGIQLPGGALADYSASTMIGFNTDSVISLPAEPSRSQHVVRVLLANGLPVVGAQVSATHLTDSAAVSGARFTIGAPVSEGVTNEFGEVYLAGYSADDSEVFVEYNDGILIQRVTKSLGERDIEIVMENMPWIEPPVVTPESSAGDLVTLNIATTGYAESAASSTRAAHPATVSIQPPKGASQSCVGKKLSATVAADGTATLKVCASKSGRYVLRGRGVVSTGAVSLNVKGTAPMPVTSARAVSPAHKMVTISWNAPTYVGGSPVKKYTVTLKRGKKTITKVVAGTSVNFDNLPGVSIWTATVTATSKSGTSEPVRMLVPVS